MSRSLLVVAGVVVVVLLFAFSTYNRLVTLQEGVDTAWSQVENVYQRRTDLIPNLVETVKGAAQFERETFEAVTAARARASSITLGQAPTAEQLAAFQAAQGEVSSALSRLLVTVEAYPQLTATQAFRDLQAQLEGTENRIANERRLYNEVTREFNIYRRQFPAVLVAGMLGFGEKALFEAEAGADEPPPVDFSDDSNGGAP